MSGDQQGEELVGDVGVVDPAGVLYARVSGFADPLLPSGTTKRFPFPDPNLLPMLVTRSLGIR